MVKNNEVHDESTVDSEKRRKRTMIHETSKHLLLKNRDPGYSFISASSEVHEFIEIDINSNIQEEMKCEASQQKLLKVSEWSAEIIKTDKFIKSIITNKPKSDVIEDIGKI
ncbi:hypothetical protein ALC57_11675 [Trachymyrmex cornetzi]|uniref:Uncharacterized protein n=1 Tax=Trachymyrmex cornetzi TaxID=471704 RepID=A0A151J274_9HYME|nr:hypothetical protein ALC57_11675 [Trachymyrmex cornetzi]